MIIVWPCEMNKADEQRCTLPTNAAVFTLDILDLWLRKIKHALFCLLCLLPASFPHKCSHCVQGSAGTCFWHHSLLLQIYTYMVTCIMLRIAHEPSNKNTALFVLWRRGSVAASLAVGDLVTEGQCGKKLFFFFFFFCQNNLMSVLGGNKIYLDTQMKCQIVCLQHVIL